MTWYLQLTLFWYTGYLLWSYTVIILSTLELMDPSHYPIILQLRYSSIPPSLAPFISHLLLPYSHIAIKASCVCQTLFQRVTIFKKSRGQRDLSCGLCQRSSTLQIRKTYLLVDTTWMLRHSWCVSSCLLKAVSRSSGRVKPYCCRLFAVPF